MTQATVANKSQLAVNSAALTYVTPSFSIPSASQANGSHFRITVAGEQSLVFNNGQLFGGGILYNVHVGPAGTVADPIVFSQSDSNPAQQFFKEFIVGLRANGANGIWIAATQPSSTGNTAVTPATVNVATTSTNYIGLSIKTLSASANSYANVEIAAVEQVL